MKTKLLTTAIVCALLISITGCAADNTEQMLHNDAEVIVNTETVTEPSADGHNSAQLFHIIRGKGVRSMCQCIEVCNAFLFHIQ